MDARPRLPRASVALPALLAGLLLVLVPAAHAQGTPLPVTTPIEPVTPPIQPVTPVTPPAAATPTFAVVLVSGFNTSTPFSTPACPTAGRGTTWDETTGPASTLAAAG